MFQKKSSLGPPLWRAGWTNESNSGGIGFDSKHCGIPELIQQMRQDVGLAVFLWCKCQGVGGIQLVRDVCGVVYCKSLQGHCGLRLIRPEDIIVSCSVISSIPPLLPILPEPKYSSFYHKKKKEEEEDEYDEEKFATKQGVPILFK